MEEIDVAVFAFDSAQRLALINRAGERLLAQPANRLANISAAELGLADCLAGPEGRALDLSFPGGAGRWAIRRGRFREHGRPQTLLVLSDLTRELREEELKAWQRLVRVLGHELNNSLAPIKSLAASMASLVNRAANDSTGEDWLDDLSQGLAVIGSRAESLSRFMSDYARLAKMPDPKPSPVRVTDWAQRAASLETRLKVEIHPGPDVTILGDSDQLEQLLINLLKNAVDAAQETNGGVRLGWKTEANRLELWVEDDGPGISSDANLFVPFFTTKPGGTGIGLVLCRKIAENHHGTVTLENRPETEGCLARLRLPIS
jgi:signal transduction histidine kinase